jgi:alpha-L-fucosidase
MKLLKKITIACCLLLPAVVAAQPPSLDSLQRLWVNHRFGMYIHFNMNTFYPGWAEARTTPTTFAPTNLNCGQWMKAAKSAGITFAILTTKHHDGFALWPSQQTPPFGTAKYTVAQSSIPTRDVVREYVDSCRAYGILPGMYFSMWDVASAIGGAYSVTDTIDWAKVKPFIIGQLTELLGGTYGTIPVLVLDGYMWKMGQKQIPYQEIRMLVKKLQPSCLILDHDGLKTEAWDYDAAIFEEPIGIQMPTGNSIAAHQEQTISGDWFWNSTAADSTQLKTVAVITEHLTRLEKGYCNFILNCPPNRTGQMDAAIVNRLAAVGKSWKPDTTRAPLPTQPELIERPLTPITASATSGTPKTACDGLNDGPAGPRFQTLWQSSTALPQSVTLNYGAVYDSIDMLMYLPRRDTLTNGRPDTIGNITKYSIFVSTYGTTFTKVDSGTWAPNKNIKRTYFSKQKAQYLKFQVDSAIGGSGVIGEILAGSHKIPWSSTVTVQTHAVAAGVVQYCTLTHNGSVLHITLQREAIGGGVSSAILTLYTVQGRAVQSWTMPAAPKIQVTTRMLARGIYLGRLMVGGHEFTTRVLEVSE